MSSSDKRTLDSKRSRYVRVLERFIRSVIGYLVKEEDTSFEGFQARVEKQNRFLAEVEAVVLYKEEFIIVEKFVIQLRGAASRECEDFSKLREDFLHQSNQLHKHKNQRKYKKDKHENSKFKDWE